ncbi:MAG: RNase A-like domain-containing protein [Deltaproteobacteria bacterium]|nr:RNase A-like domain-containing protein [Deltaproteobacteria bacterium]
MIRRALLALLLLLAALPALAREQLPPPTVGRGDDRWGGHTVERHVGKSDEELRARLARDSRLSTASAWDSAEIATQVIDATLKQHAGELLPWLARAPPGARKVIDHRGSTRIGRAVRADDPRKVVPLSNARLVIEALGQGRWRLITAYPNF